MVFQSTLMAAAFGALCTLPGAAAGAGKAAPDCPVPVVNNVSGGDYTSATDRERLGVVEQFHFTPPVERLEKGVSGHLGADIGYVLDHFANHHRALAALARLSLRDKTTRPHGAKYSTVCYFDRAIRYRPDDARVRAIFGGYLLALGQDAAALAQLEDAARLEPRNATNQYNLGLLYLRQKDYAKARMAAQQAYQLGFPLPGLKNKLAAAGQWQEAPPRRQAPAGAQAGATPLPAAELEQEGNEESAGATMDGKPRP
ncbi:ABC transporter permease [Pseudoduganella buxea]|uniref:ABC transporter permease n=1 Tax=Pseudoduganella buxea TaxID=1949069 RepID=A0A6I3SZL3_9BURK|nr:ABC transporter permease [Pseudoduganella buxea]MTV54740.1 ABC transporter permease [Pseudoduganella buxea]GGC21350.1 hypothetical protein GCM10011572_48470 [Pseudoduganella buxea]